MTIHPRITSVTVDPLFEVRLTFTDGSVGSVNLGPWIEGHGGVFAPLVLLGARSLEGLNLRVDPFRKQLIDAGPAPAAAVAA